MNVGESLGLGIFCLTCLVGYLGYTAATPPEQLLFCQEVCHFRQVSAFNSSYFGTHGMTCQCEAPCPVKTP